MPKAPPTACSKCGAAPCKDPSHHPKPSPKKYFGTNSQLYHTARWLKYRGALLAYNPQCQRIVAGIRCLKPASVVHHLVDPTQDGGRLTDPANTVCVCAAHHAGGQAGETQDEVYAPTRWFGVEFSHQAVQRITSSVDGKSTILTGGLVRT